MAISFTDYFLYFANGTGLYKGLTYEVLCPCLSRLSPRFYMPLTPVNQQSFSYKNLAAPALNDSEITPQEFRTKFPVLTQWTDRLNQKQKQEIRDLVAWLSFASYNYGLYQTHDEPCSSVKKDVLQKAIHGDKANFPVSELALTKYIMNGFTNADPALGHIPIIAKHLIDIAYISDTSLQPPENTPLTQAFLNFLSADSSSSLTTASSASPITCEMQADTSVEGLLQEYQDEPFNEWPPTIKRFIFLTSDIERGTNFHDIDLHGITLQELHCLHGCDFTKAIFDRCVLTDLSMQKTNLEDASFKEAELTRIDLRDAKMKNTDFTNAHMFEIRIEGADLRDANLTDTQITLTPKSLNYVDDYHRDILLNHVNHDSGTGLLTAIDSIGDPYPIKLKLMSDVIDALFDARSKGCNITDTYRAFAETLLPNLHYLKEPRIARFIDLLIAEEIRTANYYPWKPQEAALPMLIDHALKNLEDNDWALQNSAYLTQLMHHCEHAQDLSLAKPALALRTAYMNHEDIAPLAAKIEENFGCTKYEKDFYVLVCAHNDKKEGLIFDDSYYKKNFLDSAPIKENDLENVFWFKQNDEMDYEYESIQSLEKTFKPFPLLMNRLIQSHHQGLLLNFFETLHLGKYQAVCKQALNHRKHVTPFVSGEDQKDFKEIFNPLYVLDRATQEEEPLFIKHSVRDQNNTIIDYFEEALFVDKKAQLTTEHFEQIMQSYASLISDQDVIKENYKKASLLFSLAIVFTALSSNKFLGTETESPAAVRQYAVALLNKASELEPQLLSEVGRQSYKAQSFSFYLQVLNGELPSCTQILSDDMILYAKKMAQHNSLFQKIFQSILPKAWL